VQRFKSTLHLCGVDGKVSDIQLLLTIAGVVISKIELFIFVCPYRKL
jgi:hypothetical protein